MDEARGVHLAHGPTIEGKGPKVCRRGLGESGRVGPATFSEKEGELVDYRTSNSGRGVGDGIQLSLESSEILCFLLGQDAIGLCFKTGNLFGPAGGVFLFLTPATAVRFLFLGLLVLVLFLLPGDVMFPLSGADEVLVEDRLEGKLGDDLGTSVVGSGRELKVGA